MAPSTKTSKAFTLSDSSLFCFFDKANLPLTSRYSKPILGGFIRILIQEELRLRGGKKLIGGTDFATLTNLQMVCRRIILRSSTRALCFSFVTLPGSKGPSTNLFLNAGDVGVVVESAGGETLLSGDAIPYPTHFLAFLREAAEKFFRSCTRQPHTGSFAGTK
ncbi:hypothetical protein ACOSQ3_017516 [Xanthoceras sorbifolium]